ncbi:MFS transporter [Nocardioides dongxiaopingii]|uniref:MFS transporter n=1 Tax=Nocardioides dongxiaopingii TaxID=2576036 RepID=UPI001485757C|nr:MFS transporter [Nocardioides dongxiaopingii]
MNRPGFRSALASTAFRRLCLAHGLATVGQLVVTLAVGVHVLAETRSGVWVSVTVASAFAPYALCSALAGVLADRRSRSAVLAGAAWVRAALALVLVTGTAAGWPVAVLAGVTALVAVAATPSFPSLAAATPQCVPDRDLPPANALVTCVENVTWIGGPGVFGLLVLAGAGTEVTVLVAAVLFAVAGTVAASVRLRRPARDWATGWWADLVAGVAAVVRRPEVRRPMGLAVVDNLLYGYLVVAIVLLADAAPGDDDPLGLLNAALTVGALASMLVVNRCTRGDRTSAVLVMTLLGFCLTLAALGAVGATALGVALLVVAGGTTMVAEVAAVTLLQRSTDTGTLARVFGIYDQLNVGAIALGSLAAGPLSAVAGPHAGLVAVAGLGIVLTLPALLGQLGPARAGAGATRRRGRLASGSVRRSLTTRQDVPDTAEGTP